MKKHHYALLAVILLLVEIAIAIFVPGGTFIRASFGDFLVVILIYCSVRAVFDVNPLKLAIAVCLFAFAVEFAQYFHFVDRVGIKSQFWRTIIGTSYSTGDLVMYAAGCLTIYVIDRFALN
ncbi:MAG: DUF2809 domain-containing protein [Leucothrix sp.]